MKEKEECFMQQYKRAFIHYMSLFQLQSYATNTAKVSFKLEDRVELSSVLYVKGAEMVLS
jgi:hypothetical protein